MCIKRIVDNSYNKIVGVRNDPYPFINYPKITNYPDITKEDANFMVNNYLLKGAFYYKNQKDDNKLIIYDHGMFSGRCCYYPEIAILVRNGYTVFSYDHIGCFESEGENVEGLAASLRDLDYAIKYLISLGYKENNIGVMGHSWGGYSTMNIVTFYPDIAFIIPICGFVSIKNLMKTYFNGFLRLYQKYLCNKEKKKIGEKYLQDGIKNLQNYKHKALIYGDETDKVVKPKNHFDLIKKKVTNPNVIIRETTNKGHRPLISDASTIYNKDIISRYKKAVKKKEIKNMDDKIKFYSDVSWDLYYEQDTKEWDYIIKFIKGNF